MADLIKYRILNNEKNLFAGMKWLGLKVDNGRTLVAHYKHSNACLELTIDEPIANIFNMIIRHLTLYRSNMTHFLLFNTDNFCFRITSDMGISSDIIKSLNIRYNCSKLMDIFTSDIFKIILEFLNLDLVAKFVYNKKELKIILHNGSSTYCQC